MFSKDANIWVKTAQEFIATKCSSAQGLEVSDQANGKILFGGRIGNAKPPIDETTTYDRNPHSNWSGVWEDSRAEKTLMGWNQAIAYITFARSP